MMRYQLNEGHFKCNIIDVMLSLTCQRVLRKMQIRKNKGRSLRYKNKNFSTQS